MTEHTRGMLIGRPALALDEDFEASTAKKKPKRGLTANPGTMLSGTDGRFFGDLLSERHHAIQLKNIILKPMEVQFMLDVAAMFSADVSPLDMAESSFEIDPTQQKAAAACAQRGLGSFDGGNFKPSRLGAAWLTIHFPELCSELMELVPKYKRSMVAPSDS